MWKLPRKREKAKKKRPRHPGLAVPPLVQEADDA
jgi:hypothetical protein